MQFNQDNSSIYTSAFAKPAVWCAAAVFFLILPCCVYFYCVSGYLNTSLNKAIEARTRQFKRELLYTAAKGENKRFFSNALTVFRASCFQAENNEAKVKNYLNILLENLPKNSSVILWQPNGTINAKLSQLDLQTLSSDTAQALVNKLLEANSKLSEAMGLNFVEQAHSFMRQNEAFFGPLSLATGINFNKSDIFLRPSVIFEGSSPKRGGYFFWSFLNGATNENGGFMAFVNPTHLSESFAISAVLKDQASTPEFTQGFFNLTTGFISGLNTQTAPVIKKAIELYKLSFIEKLTANDSIILIRPLPNTDSTCAFTIFSIKDLLNRHKQNLNLAIICASLLLTALLLLFNAAYKSYKTRGFSLPAKLTAALLLCAQLPIALMVMFAVRYSGLQERLLAETSFMRLYEAVNQIEASAERFYYNQNLFFKSLAALPEINCASTNGEPLRTKLSEFVKNRRIASFFLINNSGEIIFEEDSFEAQSPETKAFIAKIGRDMLLHPSNAFTGGLNSEFMPLNLTEGSSVIASPPFLGAKGFIFVSFANVGAERAAVVITQNKQDTDKEYLLSAVMQQKSLNNGIDIIILNKECITDTVPKLSNTFKANLLPLLAGAEQSDSIESDLAESESERFLVALSACKSLEDFFVGSRMNCGEITKNIQSGYAYALSASALGLIAALISLGLLLKELILPVKLLSEGAKTIAEGSLDVNLPVLSKDELGTLCLTFNTMANRLKSRTQELTILYELTQMAYNSHNRRETLSFASDELRRYLQAESGGSAIAEPGTDALTLSGLGEQGAPDEIKRVINASFEAFKPVIELGAALNRYVLSVPLFFADKRYGALYACFINDNEGKGKDLSLDKLSFIETIRHRLSIIAERQKLFEKSITDDLTKLYIYSFFAANLEHEIERSNRYGFDLALLMIDIDNFRAFNSDYGHTNGDEALKGTAQTIIKCLRTSDTAARFESDKIAVILPQTTAQEGKTAAERIKNGIGKNLYKIGSKTASITVSIGISSLNGRKTNLKTLVEESSKALYNAKQSGKNKVMSFFEAV